MINLKAVRSLLDTKEKKKLNIIILINIFNFILEMLCLLSIPVFTSLLINPKILINKIDFYLPNLVIENITFFGGLLVILFFLLKNASLLLLTYIKSNFIKKLKIKLSTKLFNNYLFGSYENFLNQEPATISRNTSTIIQYFSDYLTHLLSFFRELSVIMMILIILIVINPITISLITLFLFLCTIFYLKKIKPSLKKKAEANQRLNKKFTQVIFESFGAIKDLKILKKEQDVFNLFYRKMSQYEDNLFFFLIFEKIPRIIIEIGSIILVLIVSFVMFNFTSNLETVLPIMALIILSIVRLVPAFSSINTSSYYMKIFEPSLNVLDEEFKKLNINNKNFTRSDTIEFLQGANHSENNLITLKNVSFNYPNNKSLKTLKNINMTVEKGDTLGIIGKSGAGKTTLMNLMTGLLFPTEGNIFFENRNIENNISEWRDKISYVSQNIYLLNDTIEKNITFNFNNEKIDKFRLERAIEISNLSKKIKLLPDGIKTCVGNDGIQISGGEKQRIAIARAIYKDPDIIFFDEFTSAIDAQTENEIINSIEKNFKEKTIILIAHRKATISRCKSVWQINNGQITKI